MDFLQRIPARDPENAEGIRPHMSMCCAARIDLGNQPQFNPGPELPELQSAIKLWPGSRNPDQLSKQFTASICDRYLAIPPRASQFFCHKNKELSVVTKLGEGVSGEYLAQIRAMFAPGACRNLLQIYVLALIHGVQRIVLTICFFMARSLHDLNQRKHALDATKELASVRNNRGVFMKFKYILGAASAAVLALGAFNTASAALTVETACTLADVQIPAGTNALACAGAFTGNDKIITDVVENGYLGVLTKDPNGPGNIVIALVEADWKPNAPNPVQPWLFGAKYDFDFGGIKDEDVGVLGKDSITNPSAGSFTVNVSPYAEFVIAFKQSTDVAFYYFTNDGSGVYNLQWDPSNGGPLAFSHISVYVRGEREVPEPATLALLGLGLVGVGLARRRRVA